MDPRDFLDRSVIARLEKQGPGFPRKLIGLYLEQAPRRLDTILAGSQAGDWKSIEEAAHALKTGAGNLGALRLRDLADRVEAAAAAGRASGGAAALEPLLAELEDAFRKTRDLLLDIRERGATG